MDQLKGRMDLSGPVSGLCWIVSHFLRIWLLDSVRLLFLGLPLLLLPSTSPVFSKLLSPHCTACSDMPSFQPEALRIPLLVQKYYFIFTKTSRVLAHYCSPSSSKCCFFSFLKNFYFKWHISAYLVFVHTSKTPVDRLVHTEFPPACLPGRCGQLLYKTIFKKSN